jgi:hypothetical protein
MRGNGWQWVVMGGSAGVMGGGAGVRGKQWVVMREWGRAGGRRNCPGGLGGDGGAGGGARS